MVQSDVDRPVKADHFNNQSFEDRSTSNGFCGRNLYDDKRIKGLLLKDLTVGAMVKNPNYRICAGILQEECFHLLLEVMKNYIMLKEPD